jgi:alcohol dehydrogenase class IV
MYKFYCRAYQTIFRGVSYLLPWRKPKLLEETNSIRLLPKKIKENDIDRVLIVTDKVLVSLGLLDELLKGLGEENITYAIYDKTVPNPTIDNIEEALYMYKSNDCIGIIAFGGGSAMDCAKGVGARVARPNKKIPNMKGVLKVRKKLPPLFAVPTTAGTGSEATIAAVISNTSTHEKFPINDVSLIPLYAILDPALTIGLPQHITSTTGVDALTHAVEAYIGRSNTKETIELSKKAVTLIYENLYGAYVNGKDLKARENMLKASFYAGISFTRAYVGYVHAVAHTLGGFYGTPHGLANAVILPYVLEYYGEAAHKPLAELADLIRITVPADSIEQKANKFIDAIKNLNASMDIPKKIKGIQDKDIPLMVERAFKESNPLYPVPRIFSREDLNNIYQLIKE